EQLEPDARVVARRREAQREQDPRETGEQPREDVQPELDPAHADAGEARGLLAGTDREDAAAERRRVQDDAERDRERDEDRERPWNLGAADRDDTDVR